MQLIASFFNCKKNNKKKIYFKKNIDKKINVLNY